jgi:hypothetical protein
VDWQLFASLALLTAAVVYLALLGVRSWRASQKTGCSGGCGCSKAAAPAAPTLIPAESLVLRSRDRTE